MLNYILNIIRDIPCTSVTNALFNILSSYREYISYNVVSDKFEIQLDRINSTAFWIFSNGGYGSIPKPLAQTNIYIQLFGNTLSFWLK